MKHIINFILISNFILIIGDVNAQIPLTQSIQILLNKNYTIVETIKQLESKTGYTFAYGNIFEAPCSAHLTSLNAPLHDILDEIFTPCNIEWNIIGEHIILNKLKQVDSSLKIIGRITDQLTGKGLDYSTVYIPNSTYGTSTDELGYYEIKGIKQSKFKLVCSMIGYETYDNIIHVNHDSLLKINIILVPKDISLEAAIFRYDRISDQTTISKITLNKSDLDNNLNISDDPLKAVAQLPSVAGNGNLLSSDQLYIRGGEPNENLLLLDNVRFLWPYYLGGTSIFNPDILKEVEIMSGEFQSKYGNAMSGIINLTTRNGNLEKFKANIGLSGFHNSFLVEGPFKKNKSSYLVAFRKTHKLSLFNNAVSAPRSNDFNIKLFFQLSKNHRLSYTNITVVDQLNLTNLYFGLDSIQLPLTSDNRIGGQSIQWQATFFGKIYNKFSIHQSDQKINLSLDNDKYPTIKTLNNEHLSMRNDLSSYIRNNIKMGLGFEFNIDNLQGIKHEIYEATDIQIADSTIIYLTENLSNLRAYIASYINFDFTIRDKWHSIFGVRLDLSNNYYTLTLSPRWNISYDYNSNLKFTGFTGLFLQDPDVESSLLLPNFKPNQVWQYNIGAQYKLNQNTYFWIETYLKRYKNLYTYSPQLEYTNDGVANAMGTELFAQHQKINFLMRLSYSISKADRKRNFHHQTHTFHFDQRHRLNYYLKYKKSAHHFKYLPVHYSLNYRLTSGTPYTEVTHYTLENSEWVAQFGDINQKRNGYYHNLNLKLTWEYYLGKRKRTRMHLFLEYWNILNTQNLAKRIYSPDPNSPSNLQIENQYHEGRIPNVGIKFWFNE